MASLPFVTRYDPLGESNSSIDPLGALQVYGALVDLLLPGLSTITTRPRYVSLVCTALRLAEERRTYPVGPAGVTQRRAAAEPYERVWALACVLAQDAGLRGAADGLRGVTFATRALRDFQARNIPPSSRYRLLKYQSRTGGIPTYWVTLTGAELVDEAGALMTDGRALAACFPELPLSENAKRNLCMPGRADGVSIEIKALHEWSAKCHLGAMGREESRLVGEALCSDDRRSCVRTALLASQRAGEMTDAWTVPALRRLRRHLERDEAAVRLLLPQTIDAIITVERFHEAVLAVFDWALFWGTMSSHRSIWLVEDEPAFRETTDHARARASDLVTFSKEALGPRLHTLLGDFVAFASDVDRCAASRSILQEVLRRHHRVQAGKIAGGIPKQEWVTQSDTGKVFRPSPRYQRTEAPRMPGGRALTHPYRLEPFIGMLRETGVLRPASD
jgi:hypothetical protein